MTLHVRSATGALLAALMVLAWALPAQATVIHKAHYTFTDSFPDVVCGVPVRHDVAGSGVAHVRVGKGDLESAFFGVDSSKATSTITNKANGNFVTFEHNQVVVDTTGSRVSGSIFRFTTIVAGQPITIRDMTGRIVARDRGVIRETYLFDTLGDATPGGLYLEQLGLMIGGPHPLFPEEVICGVVRPLLVT